MQVAPLITIINSAYMLALRGSCSLIPVTFAPIGRGADREGLATVRASMPALRKARART